MGEKDGKTRKVAISTLGCKVNQFESASFLSEFHEQDCEQVSAYEEADILVVNTCAVTARAGQQSRQLIRKLRRSNPKARLLVTGCYAQLTADELPKLVSDSSLIVIGNADKHLLVSTALDEERSVLPVKDVRMVQEICSLPVRRFSGRTRAYLRIQDGCNNFCSYCIVPYTRGRCRSLPLADVLAQVEVQSTRRLSRRYTRTWAICAIGLRKRSRSSCCSLLELGLMHLVVRSSR